MIPRVSIVMAAYNRADTLPRAIESVLRQDMPDWELIVVDDASTDGTRQVIESYLRKDARIRAAFHDRNRHVHSAKNTGFDLMRGEWFTTLDSDDEMVPSALSTMLRVIETLDGPVDAITCNCLDTTTGQFSGAGLDHDQWLDFQTLVRELSGEHWGLTRRSLLGDARFNDKMRGSAESILWYRIGRNARRYYLHKALRIYHTEGSDRICRSRRTLNVEDRIGYYREMAGENEYIEILRQYRPGEYAVTMRNIAVIHAIDGRRAEALAAYRAAASFWSAPVRLAVMVAVWGGSVVARMVLRVGILCR